MGWLTGFFASLFEKLLIMVGQDFFNWLKTQWAKSVLSKKQKEAAKAVEQDQGKPRDGEVVKHEEDDINS